MTVLCKNYNNITGQSVQEKKVLVSIRSATNRHCNGFSFSASLKEAVTQASELQKSCNNLKVIRDETRVEEGGSGCLKRTRLCSWVGGVNGGFIAGCQASVPAAVALLLLDAGVVSGLVAGIAKVGQHVRP